jgi:hypothetical protein
MLKSVPSGQPLNEDNNGSAGETKALEQASYRDAQKETGESETPALGAEGESGSNSGHNCEDGEGHNEFV